MKFAWKTALMCLLSSLALSASTGAAGEAPEGRYNGIVERNVFGLKPPPPAVPPDPPPAPAPKITLTGITTILGSKRALMKVAVPPKPPEPAKDESYILMENEREGEVEVVSIDEKKGTVVVKNHGTVQTLDFDNNGAKQVAVAAIPPPPGLARPVNAAIPPPIPAQIPAPSPNRVIPTRTMRLPSAAGAQPTATPGAPGTMGVNPSAFQGGMPGGQQVHEFSREEQTLMIEAQRMRYQQEGNPAHVIFPPTGAPQ